MKRQKYKCKNIHAYKRIFDCSVCGEPAIITYSEEPDNDKDLPVTIRRCILHVHYTKPEVEAKKPQANLYTAMTDVSRLLSISDYNAGFGKEVIKHGS